MYRIKSLVKWMKRMRTLNVSRLVDAGLTRLGDGAEMNVHSSNVESPLLTSSGPTSPAQNQLPLRELLSNTSLRGPTILCGAIMLLQQFGGINAVMFYSTPVLRPLLPNAAGLLGIGITLVNAIMTLPAIFLVDVSP
jgi:hypothetical protein